MDINFEVYKVFYYTAKNLSFSEAANHLYISQSAVSQSIKALEEKLHTKLFVRNTKQVQLTQAGALLYRHVEQAYVFLKTGERSICELDSLEQGELRIGASDTICKYYLLPYFEQFIRLYPKIQMKVINRPSPVCTELLQKGLVDVSVVNLARKDAYSNVTVSKEKSLQDLFVAGPTFRHLQQQPLSLPQIAALPILTLEKNTITRDYLDHLFLGSGLTVQPEIELGSLDLVIELAKIGLGIAFVSKEYVEKELENHSLFALETVEPIPSRRLGIMTHNALPVSAAAKKFIELLQ